MKHHFAATAMQPTKLGLIDAQAVTTGPATLPELLSTPLAARVTELETTRLVAYQPRTKKHELACAGLAFTRNLRRVRGGTDLDARSLEIIANAPELSAVRELTLFADSYETPSGDLGPLFEPKHLESLRVLRLTRGAEPEAARAPTRYSRFAR